MTDNQFMKKLHLPLLLLVCTTLFTSCTRAIVLQIFNNTEKAITVVTRERDKEERYLIVQHGSERVKILNTLKIVFEDTVWDFDVSAVPKTTTYMNSERLGPLVVKLQVENDGLVYVLSPEAQSTTTNLPPQPSGYPLRPKLQAERTRIQ